MKGCLVLREPTFSHITANWQFNTKVFCYRIATKKARFEQYMKNNKALIATLMAISLSATGALGQYIGQWDFQSGDLSASSGGDPLNPLGGATASFGTTTSLGLPDIGGEVANVLSFGKMVKGQGFQVPLPVFANPAGGQFLK